MSAVFYLVCYSGGFPHDHERQFVMSAADLRRLPVRSGLERYKNQASDLIKQYTARNPVAMRCIRQHHPRLPGRANTNDRNAVTDEDIRKAKVLFADAQSVVARWHGFKSWPKLAQHVQALARKDSPVLKFELVVEAIITGDVATLKALLREHPELVRARSTREHQATLLHYVGANGVESYRQKTPNNAVKVAEVLLKAGAQVDADLDYGAAGQRLYPERVGSTTLGMVATSLHPAVAGVQIALLRILLDAGADVNGISGGWNPLIAALHNGRGDAAVFLARRGARLDLEGAAGTGRLAVVKGFFKQDGTLGANATQGQLELGFMWACEYGRTSVVAFLLQQGMKLAAQPHGETGLHWAAYGGHSDIVKLLLKRRAPLDIKDKRCGATPLVWGLHGWCYPPPEAKRARYHEVIALLVAAGAKLDPGRSLDRSQMEKLRRDSRMLALLGSANLRK
jgi:ankyrin repeat protein